MASRLYAGQYVLIQVAPDVRTKLVNLLTEQRLIRRRKLAQLRQEVVVGQPGQVLQTHVVQVRRLPGELLCLRQHRLRKPHARVAGEIQKRRLRRVNECARAGFTTAKSKTH